VGLILIASPDELQNIFIDLANPLNGLLNLEFGLFLTDWTSGSVHILGENHPWTQFVNQVIFLL
jgi:hypothetical protein